MTITDLTKLNLKSSKKDQPEKWKYCSGVLLYSKHKRILTSRSLWLDDELINAAQSLLKKQHPLISGLQPPALSSQLAMVPPDSEFVQVVNVCNNHWLALSTVGCKQSTIKVFDSLQGGGLPKHTMKLVADLMQCQDKQITLEFVDVQEQRGSSDCGLFAIAFITSVCCGVDPATLNYNQKAMRQHLLECIENDQMKPFPSEQGRKPKPSETECLKVYCTCRLPYHGSPMVECSNCKEWYHVSCIDIPRKYLVDCTLDWFCTTCNS